MQTKQKQGQQWKRMRPIAMAMAMLGAGANAHAFNIDVGNEDIEMRWDNTLRYNTAVRMQDRNRLIANSPNSDEGTYSFDKHD